jgi:hypothetical protein
MRQSTSSQVPCTNSHEVTRSLSEARVVFYSIYLQQSYGSSQLLELLSSCWSSEALRSYQLLSAAGAQKLLELRSSLMRAVLQLRSSWSSGAHQVLSTVGAHQLLSTVGAQELLLVVIALSGLSAVLEVLLLH